jgi:hypothetical protein
MRGGLLAVLGLVACDADPDGLNGVVDPTGSPPTDELLGTPEVTFGPAVVVDDLHIASLFEEANAFSLLGTFLDPLIADQIAAGTLLLGIELRDLDDPSLQNDDAMSVGLHTLVDDDGDPADNFDPATPETFTVPATSFIDDQPALHFVDGSLTAGALAASGLGTLDALGALIPLPVSGLELEGDVVAADGAFQSLEEGRLRGAVGLSLLALSPNLLAGTCPGATLLDVLATGCGLFGLQPDADVDGDGLERLYDDDGDGAIDRCVDGDGTEILGVDCPQDPAMADGYTLILVVHGVRAELVVAPPTTGG